MIGVPIKRGNVDKRKACTAGRQCEDPRRTLSTSQGAPKTTRSQGGGRDRTLSHGPQKQPVLLTMKMYVPAFRVWP